MSAPTSSGNRWWLVVGAGLIIFMAQLDTFIATVALPSIEADLDTHTSVTEWVVLGYLLPMIALSLPAGRWLDEIGRRAALTFATAGFAGTSLAAALAPGIGWLIAARVAQGGFAALMLAMAPALASDAVRPELRGRAQGIVATLGPLGAVSGPALGGVLVETVGWAWIFYVNVPVAAIVIGIGLTQLPADGRLRAPQRQGLAEIATLGAACACVLLGLSLTASHGPTWLALTVLAVPLLAAWRQLEAADTAIGLLRLPSMAALHVAVLGTYTAFLLVFFLVPFYVDQVQGRSAAVAGAILLAIPVAEVLLGPIGGVLADRWGTRPTTLTGLAVLAGGFLSLVPLGEGWSSMDLALRLAVVGIGLGLFLGPMQAMAMANAPVGMQATTGASVNVARQLGVALGPALGTVIWVGLGHQIGSLRLAFGVAAGLAVLSGLALATAGTTRRARDLQRT